MQLKEKIYFFLKKNIPNRIKNYLYLILHLKNNIKIILPKWILKYLITDIYDKNNKKIFTLRNFGGLAMTHFTNKLNLNSKLFFLIYNS